MLVTSRDTSLWVTPSASEGDSYPPGFHGIVPVLLPVDRAASLAPRRLMLAIISCVSRASASRFPVPRIATSVSCGGRRFIIASSVLTPFFVRSQRYGRRSLRVRVAG